MLCNIRSEAMEIVARGWKRDHGAKEIAHADLGNAVLDEDVTSYQPGETYIRKLRPRVRITGSGEEPAERNSEQPRVRISMSADLILNGRYQIQCYLTKNDIADLFQLTHADDSLDELVATLAELREARK
jgi:hypothetical protein